MRVTFPPLGAWCWMRKEREGTVLRAVGEMGWMNWWHGSVKCPADKAWTVTKGRVGGSVGGADDMAEDEGGLLEGCSDL
jgi:hypothetical protein